MTGKCPHGFASSQGTCQTNNVHKHKKDRRRERDKWERTRGQKGARPKPSLLVEAEGQRRCRLWGESKAPLFLHKQELEMETSFLLFFSLVEAGSNLDSFTQKTSSGWMHADYRALGLSELSQLCECLARREPTDMRDSEYWEWMLQFL